MACAAGMEYQCQCGDGKMTDPANRFKCIEAVSFAGRPHHVCTTPSGHLVGPADNQSSWHHCRKPWTPSCMSCVSPVLKLLVVHGIGVFKTCIGPVL